MLNLVDGSHKLLHAWKLALLRFAVTRDESDRHPDLFRGLPAR